MSDVDAEFEAYRQPIIAKRAEYIAMDIAAGYDEQTARTRQDIREDGGPGMWTEPGVPMRPGQLGAGTDHGRLATPNNRPDGVSGGLTSDDAIRMANEQMQHKGLPVHGYRAQSNDAVGIVNQHKIIEETILRLMDGYAHSMDAAVDKRWLAIARTDIEKGFMALNRAIFKPERIKFADEV